MDVRVEGFTELDKRRLGSVQARDSLGSGDSLRVTIVSRLSMSGPANVVVSYVHSIPGSRFSDTLLVPSD